MTIEHTIPGSNCSESAVRLFIDSEMTEFETAQFEHHLTKCPKCHELLNQEKGLSLILSASLDPSFIKTIPPGFSKTTVLVAANDVAPVRRWREMIISFGIVLLLSFVFLAVTGADSGFALSGTVLSVVSLGAGIILQMGSSISVFIKPIASQLGTIGQLSLFGLICSFFFVKYGLKFVARRS